MTAAKKKSTKTTTKATKGSDQAKKTAHGRPAASEEELQRAEQASEWTRRMTGLVHVGVWKDEFRGHKAKKGSGPRGRIWS